MRVCNVTLKSAFTLIEILLVLALIGLIMGIFTANFDVLLRSFEEKPPEKLVYEIIREARYQAVYQHAQVFLNYDKAKQMFVVTDEEANVLSFRKATRNYSVFFEPVPPKVYGKSLQYEDTTLKLGSKDSVAFRPDSSSEPVIIRILQDDADFTVNLKLDPFSCSLTSFNET